MSKVTTPAGLTYVKDFSFPAAQGFSGSAGSHQVRGYQRGGAVKKAPVKKAKGGTAMRDGRDLHSKMYDSGLEMGFKRGGQVKASPDFKMKTGKQKTMDHGNMPARKGCNTAEIEAGGTKKMRPGYAVGGMAQAVKAGVHQVCSKAGYKKAGEGARKGQGKQTIRGKLKRLKGTISDADRKAMDNYKGVDRPVKKARGGSVKK